jgi:hypothetical protein
VAGARAVGLRDFRGGKFFCSDGCNRRAFFGFRGTLDASNRLAEGISIGWLESLDTDCD